MLTQALTLPEDPEELRSFTARLLVEVKAQAILIEKLRHQLAGHRAQRFGASSETAERLQCALESSEIAAAAMTARMKLSDIEERDKPKRRPITDHIPRMEVKLTPGADACAGCGGWLRRIGEDVTEELEYVPGASPLSLDHWRKMARHREPHRPPASVIRDVACMAHVRRKFVDIHRSEGSPIDEEAIGRITQFYAVEKEARGSPPDRRAELRKAHAAPVVDDLEVWLAIQLTTISGKSPPAGAIRYAISRMERMRPYLDRGILELDNNGTERGMRTVALGRKNYLFVGSEAGGKAAAIAYTLIETAKLNAVDPNAWLADTLARIPDYKITKVEDLLPRRWNR